MHTAGVITVSDTRSAGTAEDQSGPAAEKELALLGARTTDRAVVPDEIEAIAGAVRGLVGRVGLIVTTGGTGVSRRDVTPEAIVPMLEQSLPGFGEIMRTGSFGKTPLSIISRGGAGIIGRTLVVMLPGSPRGVRESLELLGPAIRHLLKVLSEEAVDCEKEAEGGA